MEDRTGAAFGGLAFVDLPSTLYGTDRRYE